MAQYMLIKIDLSSGEVIDVTDENGNQAQQGDLKNTSLPAAKLGEIRDMHALTLMKTSASPDCQWILKDGRWWYVCS